MLAAPGALLWTSAQVLKYPGARTNASPKVYGNLLFFGYSGPEGDANQHAGHAIIMKTAADQIAVIGILTSGATASRPRP